MSEVKTEEQAKSTKLKEWIIKNSTHAELATIQFDTLASDPEAEAGKALADLESQATQNI